MSVHLKNYFSESKALTELKGDLTIPELLDKLFRKNTMQFLKRHF